MRSRTLTRLLIAAIGSLSFWCAGSLGAVDDDVAEAEAPARNAQVPSGVRPQRDLAYGDEPEQRMDVYVPQRAASAPVFLMVHGGAWMVGDKARDEVVGNKLVRWAQQGAVFVSVNYRLSPKADPLQQANDVARALAYAQAHAKSWGGDPARFVLVGHSSGAHLVALLAADPTLAARAGAQPWLGTIAIDSAALDMVRVMQDRHMRFYDRVFGADANFWREASPFHRLKGAVGPLLMVCSNRRMESCAQARSFADKVTALGGRATVVPVPLSHAELNQQLGAPGDYTEKVDGFLRGIGAFR